MCIFQSEQVIKLRNVLISLETTNGHRIRQISNNWIIMCGTWCWDAIRNTVQNCPSLPSWSLPCYQNGMICHRSSLIRQSRHFERDFDHVLLQLVDVLTQFKYREGSWHSSLKRLNCWRKSCAKFDSLVLTIQDARLHVYLKKWTLNFKLVYLLNHVCYCNKICRICRLNPNL